ncbi:hypothetical protein [Corynebacterium sp. CCM 9204]|uniref:hypothetical protein n=1 Tax=Corynebacterium sp. CCM 9204 TaxID=3057616 RepID=UPI003525BB32
MSMYRYNSQHSAPREISPIAPAIPSRQLTAPILGATSPNGDCAPSMADISHEQPTAHITYIGKPGDEIVVTATVGTGVTGTCHIPVDDISGEPTPLP